VKIEDTKFLLENLPVAREKPLGINDNYGLTVAV
jgi:hypothetical protein